MQVAIREWLGAKRLRLHVLWFLVTVALLAYLGPFGTGAPLTVVDGLLFWTTAVGVNWLVGHIVFRVTIQSFRRREWPAWIGLALAALVAALPGTGAVWLAVAIYLDHRPSGASEAVRLYTQVFVLHLIIGSLAHHFIERALRQRDVDAGSSPPADEEAPPAPPGAPEASSRTARAGRAETTAPPGAPAAALLARLSERSRAELLHLRMQDHYVEVHTAAGSELLLLRFRDALREVEAVDGLQVHRSHWVARAAVAGVERQRGGRVVLRLVNGGRVPVSRSFAPVLKARGWI